MRVVDSMCGCSQPHYLKSCARCRPQISTYSLIVEKGDKNEKVSPPKPLSTQENASREVCAKEGRSLMRYVGSTGAQPPRRMHM